MYKIRMMLLSNGTTPDVLEVQNAINERIKDDGIELEFVIMDWSFPETIGLMVSGGEELDLAPIWAWNISNDISQGKLLPITKYLTTTLKGAAEYEKDYLPAVTYKGEVYGLPTIRDMAQSFGICFREDILTKYGFNIKDIKTDADLEKVFETIYPKEPDLMMLYTQGSGNSVMQQLHQTWDNLGDEYGVLMNWGQDIPFKVVDLFSQPTYEEQARLARKWYQNGWIVKDATTNPQGGALQIGAGKLVAFSSNLKPGFDAQSTLGAGGVKIVQSDFTPALATTTVVSLINWCMPITCKNPEKTSIFLEKMYTDPVIWNLINWGIEGKHYKKLTNNIATYADGVDASNSGYIMNLTWFYGNSLMPGALMWEGNDDDVNARMLEFNRTAIKSKAFGFNFDTTPVRNATTAVANVVAEFRLALDDGLLDVDQNLPKFRQALKDAGIDDIIAEKQKQLDAWAHEQGLY
ncbi:ABC transporter substrate-binding protein [Spirochaetia bacterium]|nr:ABC transporter substrate-binding protein [Spirochaetia bacterium]